MPTSNSLENTTIHAKDGTLRYFLNLSDGSDNEAPIEELSNIPKEAPVKGDNWKVVKEGEYKEIPLSIVENLLGTSTISDDEREQAQVLKFIAPRAQSERSEASVAARGAGYPENGRASSVGKYRLQNYSRFKSFLL